MFTCWTVWVTLGKRSNYQLPGFETWLGVRLTLTGGFRTCGWVFLERQASEKDGAVMLALPEKPASRLEQKRVLAGFKAVPEHGPARRNQDQSQPCPKSTRYRRLDCRLQCVQASAYIASNAADVAATVSSISSWLCAADTNAASNCEGGKYTPRASRARKK